MSENESTGKKSIGVALTSLIENTPLVIILIGLFLAVISAAGGWPNYGLKITESGWRIALALMGLVTAGVGVLLYFRKDSFAVAAEGLAASAYEIKIVSPEQNEEVTHRIYMRGVCRKEPPSSNEVRVFVVALNKHYYSAGKVLFKGRSNWEADCWIGSENNQRINLVVAILGKAGQALCEYYDKVASTEGIKSVPGIEKLTPDILLCDSVAVKIVENQQPGR